ncbi:MAG: hypothetical protein ACE5IR_11800 [bacterium]
MILNADNIGEVTSRKGFFKYTKRPTAPETLVKAKLINEPFRFKFGGGKIQSFDRGYIVIFGNGKIAAMDFEKFNDLYESIHLR